MSESVFYYSIDTLLKRIQARSLYHEDGLEKEFDNISIGEDDLDMAKDLLKDASIEVFKMLQPFQDDITDVYVFDDTLTIDEVDYEDLVFVAVFPSNFNTNNVTIVDNAIKNYLVALTVLKWFSEKGRVYDKIVREEEKTLDDLKSSLNDRKSLSRTYSMY